MASLTGNLVAETYKALLKTIDNDILTASEKQITDGFGGGSNVFIDSNGFLRANKYKVTNGLATQFLKADGSLDANTYLTSINSSQIIAALGFTPVTNARTLTINGTTYDLSANRTWTIDGTSAVWGNISGTLSNQTDLQTALNAKFNNPTGTISQYIRGDGSLATFPAITGFVPYTGATQDVDLGTHTLLAHDLVIDHASSSGTAVDITKGGSGIAVNIEKSGSGEALTVVKSSGSGNAASITGGTTLISELHLTTKLADAYISSAATWNAKQNALNGTGFVKVSGTTITYDNSTYLTTADAASTYQRLDKMVSNLLASATEYPNSNAVINALALKADALNPVFTGYMTISGAEPKLYFTDTDQNPDYFIGADAGFFRIYDQTAGATRFVINSSGVTTIAGDLIVGTIAKSGGTATQFLKADGSIDSSTYVTSASLANYLLISTAASTYQRLDKMVSNLLASDTEYPNSNAVLAKLALKADAANPVFTGDMTISGIAPKLYFTDTDNNPDYTLFVDSGYFYIYDQTAGATKFQITPSGNAINTGTLTSASFIKSGGTSSQFLMADGSVSTGVANNITGSGTATRIAFFDGTNTITSSSGLYWDNSAGRLAVGKNSADARLEVYAGTKGQIRANGGTAMGGGVDIYTELSGTGRRNWGIYTEVQTPGDMSFLVSASAGTAPIYEVLTMQATGIGSYKYDFNVVGKLGAADDKGLYLRSTNDVTHRLYYSTTRIGMILEINNTFSIDHYNSGSPNTIFQFSTGGNFSNAGTITSAGLISGQSSIYQTNASGSIASNRFETYNGGATQMQFLFPASGSVGFNNGTDRLVISQEGNLLLSSGATIYNSSGALYLRSGTSGDLILGSGGSNDRIRIVSGGNIGINGTPAPYAKLNIFDTGVVITNGNAIAGTNMKGIFVENTNNGDESIGVWFRTGSNHLSGISGQRDDNTAGWGTDLRFYTHERATQDLPYAKERMRLTTEGYLLIGTRSISGYRLEVSGSVLASAYYESSDSRLKNISKKYDSNNFGAIEFNWLDKKDSKNHWGYVAQDVQKWLPDAVNVGNDGFLSVDYNQAHTYKIAKVEDEITTLKKRVAELEKQLNLN
jgi:hypothetical protein